MDSWIRIMPWFLAGSSLIFPKIQRKQRWEQVMTCLVGIFYFTLLLMDLLFGGMLLLFIYKGFLTIKKERRLISYLPMLFLLLATSFSYFENDWGITSLVAAYLFLTLIEFFKKGNFSLKIWISIFDLFVFLLLFVTTSGQKSILILLLILFNQAIESVLYYLTKETDLIYARSLDQIMTNYISEVDHLYQNIRGWRHDYHSHLQALKAYLDQGQTSEIRNYLGQLEQKLVEVDQIVQSGNTMLDAIINSKLTIAEEKQIQVNASVFVGQQPLIDDVDLCVILGNILDNAIEACEEIEQVKQRQMRVYISILKQQLYLSVTNFRALDQQIQKDFSSTKNDKRGLGIRRINELVAKYNGVINRQYEEEVFVTEVLLPLATISELESTLRE